MTVTVTPGLTLEAVIAFASLANDFDEELPAFALDNTITMAFTGSPAELFMADSTDAVEGYVKVVSGELSFKSTSNPEDDVMVGQGMCLFAEEDEPTTEPVDPSMPASDADGGEEMTSLWSGLSSGSCP